MTEGRGRNRRAGVRVTLSLKIQREEHRLYTQTTNSLVGGRVTRHKPTQGLRHAKMTRSQRQTYNVG